MSSRRVSDRPAVPGVRQKFRLANAGPARRALSDRTPSRALFESLEPRRMLALAAPSTTIVYAGYREAPDGGTARAHIIWVDLNTTETGYRVETSPDGVTNWTPVGPDLPANTNTTTALLDAGQKAFYRVFALQGTALSPSGPVATCSMPVDRAVQLSASSHGGTVTIIWPANADAISYNVFRKARTDSTWTLLTLRPLPARSTGYTDMIRTGSAYEYQVQRSMHNYFYGADGVALGYVYAGNQLTAAPEHGRALLLVDQTLSDSLSDSLTTYRRDLLHDGWDVDEILVPRDNGDAHLASTVKAMIQAEAASSAGGIQSIVLIGHVPVPYSGASAWDGHPNHVGAWPADAYYGESIGVTAANRWTDVGTFSNPTYPDNNNVPGDGKFDQDVLPNAVNVPVGRIDFANLLSMRFTLSPVPATDQQAEPLLIARYLQKDHLWRIGQVDVPVRAIEDDELGGTQAENGWRNFAPLVGINNTTPTDWQTQLAGSSNLWSFGLGAGAADVATNVVSTLQLHSSTSAVSSVFSMFYGSYFGDWNKQSDLMREVIASQGTSLVSMWVGAPNWFVHTMGLGETIGQAAMLTQNNATAGAYTPTSSGQQSPAVALMGDPTLTMTVAKPVAALRGAAAFGGNTLSWSAPASAIVSGYYVYRAASADGPFTQLAFVPALSDGSTPSYTDPVGGLRPNYTYMIRANELQFTASGSYWNLSSGVTVRLRFNGSAPIPPADATNPQTGVDSSTDEDGDVLDQLSGDGEAPLI